MSSVAEVIAICGFVFGVACKLPPSLTILLLCGVFWFVIGRHFFWDILYKRVIHPSDQYDDIEDDTDGVCTVFFKRKVVPLLECVALLMQLGAVIAIPVLLAFTEDQYRGNNDQYMTMYILIPVTLTVLSIVWSGWLQKYLVEVKNSRRSTVQDEESVARMKSGNYLIIIVC